MVDTKIEEILAEAAKLAERREPYVLATVVWRRAPSSAKPGARAIVRRDGSLVGWIGGGCSAPAVVRESLKALKEGTARLVHLAPEEELPPARQGVVVAPLTCASEGALEVFIEPHVPRAHLAIVGAAPVARVLEAMAGALGYDVTSVDAAETAELRAKLTEARVGASTFVIVATLDSYDEAALEAALATRAPYVALVASRKRATAVLRALQSAGVEKEELERIRSPAGLDLGPLPHEEIAVAILAEIVQLKAQGLGASSGAPQTDAPETADAGETAVDPVCGMTVETSAARFTAERQGQRFYFCCDGCRRRFESEPQKYLKTGS